MYKLVSKEKIGEVPIHTTIVTKYTEAANKYILLEQQSVNNNYVDYLNNSKDTIINNYIRIQKLWDNAQIKYANTDFYQEIQIIETWVHRQVG